MRLLVEDSAGRRLVALRRRRPTYDQPLPPLPAAGGKRDGRRLPRVLVIGAGAAGLACARALAEAGGVEVVVLEGRDRVGGRMHTMTIPGLPQSAQRDDTGGGGGGGGGGGEGGGDESRRALGVRMGSVRLRGRIRYALVTRACGHT